MIPETFPSSRQSCWVFSALFFGTLLLFWRCAAPTVTFHDSGEFALAAATGGIPHPPGAPTYCLLASAFVRLVIGFTGDAARSTNLFSGLCGAITITLAAITAVWWGRIVLTSPALNGTPPRTPAVFPLAVIAAIVPAVLLYSPAFMEQSTTTEQYTLLTALEITVVLLGTALSRKKGSPAQTWFTAAIGLTIGLAIGNHLSQIVLIPFALLAVWESVRKSEIGRPWRRMLSLTGAGTGGMLLGLLVFLYVPIRSHANPLLDWGNVETADRLVWAITRQEWKVRPIGEAPPGFIWEWFSSYALPEQIGYAGIILTIVGLLVLARRNVVLLGWLAMLTVPYGAGMLISHLRQQGIGLVYLREYGVTDWHIPLYTLAAIVAGVGAGVLTDILIRRFGRRTGYIAASAVVLLISVSSVFRALNHSMALFTAPVTLTEEILAPLPEGGSVVVPGGDNLVFLLLYHAYGRGLPSSDKDPFITYSQISPLSIVEKSLKNGKGWGVSQRQQLIEDIVRGPFSHSMVNIPAPSEDKLRLKHLFFEYSGSCPAAAQWLLPSGYLFQLSDLPVSDDAVRTREQEWQKRQPEMLQPPGQSMNPREKEARALMHSGRGTYFRDRHMWPEAIEAYTLSVAYSPHNADLWCGLGSCYDSQGSAAKAAEAYSQSLAEDPDASAARVNLAILQATSGSLAIARDLLEEELARHPDNASAKANIEIVTRQEKASAN